MRSVNPAVVIDIPGEHLPHNNGPHWTRVVMQPHEAMQLYQDLYDHLNGDQ